MNPYAAQAFTVEYSIPGALNGLTLSPPLVAPQSNTDPQGIYRPQLEEADLGLINVDYRAVSESERRGALGNRYVSFLTLEASSVGAPGAAVQVVDALVDPAFIQEEVADLAGESFLYRERGILVPQGSLLRVVGFAAGPTPHLLRFTAQYLDVATLIEAQKSLPPAA